MLIRTVVVDFCLFVWTMLKVDVEDGGLSVTSRKFFGVVAVRKNENKVGFTKVKAHPFSLSVHFADDNTVSL